MSNFSEISGNYEKDSVVQRSASEILLDLLQIGPTDDVLDLGCGTGHLSKLIRERTRGRIVGVDPSSGMIEKARERFGNQDISFHVGAAEKLDYRDEFDRIFCNSALQWFANPEKAIAACHAALRADGKMAIQAPARDDYCPNFLRAMDDVRSHPATRNVFGSFRPPWFFRNTAEEYAHLFDAAGFAVDEARIDQVVSLHMPDEVFRIFESGAAAGYLNQEYYGAGLSREYIDAFRTIVRKSFEDQATEGGQVRLMFYRIYLLATRRSLKR